MSRVLATSVADALRLIGKTRQTEQFLLIEQHMHIQTYF